MASDPLDDVFNLEDQFYDEGYQQGLADGLQAGKLEGRSVGLAKGFDKFLESGRLYGKAVIWANRLPQPQPPPGALALESPTESGDSQMPTAIPACQLGSLPNNARLGKNIASLLALVEPDTLSTSNTDEAVDDFDDRVKRAQGKTKIIERIVGEAQKKPAPAGSVRDT